MHTSTYTGIRVIVFLKCGGQIRGKFVKRHSKYVELDCGKIPKASMRAMVIDRKAESESDA